MKNLLKLLPPAAMVAWFGYLLSGWYTYTGAWQWLAEWELRQFGSYRERATLVALIAAPIVAANVPLLIVNIIRPNTVPYFLLGRPTWGVSIDPGRMLGAIAGLALVAGATAGVLGYVNGRTPRSFEAIDLAHPSPPASRHGELTGIVQTEAILVFRKSVGGAMTSETYIPVTAPDWRVGEPVSFFLKPQTSGYGDRLYQPGTPPFAIKQTGTIFADGLPGVVRTEYERRGYFMAQTVYVLDTDTKADVTVYYVVAGVSALCLLVTLPVWLIVRVKQRRAARIG
jgi:hypothetical protein